MLSSDKSDMYVSGEVNLSSMKVNLSSSKVGLSKILILKSIVCGMCVMFSSDVSWGTDEKGNDLNKENDEIEINVEKWQEAPAGQIEAQYKVVLLGDQKVGKTQILNKINNNTFDESSAPTIGFEFSSIYYKYTIKNTETPQFIRLQIWDTSGREIYQSLVSMYLKNSHVVVLVYDITQKESFQNIPTWLKAAQDKATKEAVYFLVGNETDKENERAVSTEEAQNFAKGNNMNFFEVSAKGGNSINELFEAIAKECIKKYLLEKLNGDTFQNNNLIPLDNKIPTDTSNYEKTINSDKRCNCCPCNKDKKDEGKQQDNVSAKPPNEELI